jgi:hypothetical protein
MLNNLVGIIATGRTMSVMAADRDDKEMRKTITAAVVAGDALVALDNATGPFGCPSLNTALTGEGLWEDRLLGTNTQVKLPMKIVFSATANNPIVDDETFRRHLPIVLYTEEEFPEDKEGFKYPNIIQHTHEHRGMYLSALLTILRGYCAAGRPDMNLAPWGSFEVWSGVVRNAVVWAGEMAAVDLPDPYLANKEQRQVDDPKQAATKALLRCLHSICQGHGRYRHKGLLANDIITESKLPMDTNRELRDALCQLCQIDKGEIVPHSLGNKLRHLQNRNISGLMLKLLPGEHHAARWMVVKVDGGLPT